MKRSFWLDFKLHRCVTDLNHKSVTNIPINNIRHNIKDSFRSFHKNLNNVLQNLLKKKTFLNFQIKFCSFEISILGLG